MNLDTIIYSENVIKEKRNLIRKELFLKSNNIKSGIIEKISERDLSILFDLYDKYFFCDFFKKNLTESLTQVEESYHREKENLSFTLSNRMTSAAGKTLFWKSKSSDNTITKKYEIRMGVKFFFQYYDLAREKLVCGIKTKDSLEAFFIVWEHELCHLIELYYFEQSSCKNNRFKKIAHNLFGHTDVFHQLPTNKEIAYDLHGISIGTKVKFQVENSMKEGFVHKINKRATVMVIDKNGEFIDNKNIRYSKWYVPLNKLIKQ